MSHEKGGAKQGIMMPMIAIADKLGANVDRDEALRMAKNYCAMCELPEFASAFVEDNTWLKARLYKFEEKLAWEISKEKWEQIARQSNSENKWDKKLMEARAIRNYSMIQGHRLDKVTLAMVVAHPWGVDGWATMTVTQAGLNKDGAQDSHGASCVAEVSTTGDLPIPTVAAGKARAKAAKAKAKATADKASGVSAEK